MAGWIKATYDNIDETVWLNLSRCADHRADPSPA